MKKMKLKGFVLPTIYFIITVGIFVGVMLLGQAFKFEPSDYDYGVGALKDDSVPVVNEDNEVNLNISSPVSADIKPSIHFYGREDTPENQQNSLIYYESTYIPNTGVLYASDTEFEVRNVFEGKVTEITDDEFFGKCIVIEHSPNLRTYYYGVKDIEVNIGDELTTNAVLGVSNNNTIMNDKQTLLFETYYNNKLINPETFIGSKITDYK